MNLDVHPDLEARLTQLAARRGSDNESLAIEAIERMIEYEPWFDDQVRSGLNSIEQNHTMSHEEVGVRLDRYLTSRTTSP